MANATRTSRGRKQDRARVAGGQNYEGQTTGRSKAGVKRAVNRVGNSRRRIESALSQ